MTELQCSDRKHGERGQPCRIGGLAAILGHSRWSFPAVLTSPTFADRAGPFQSHPRGGLGGSKARGEDDFATSTTEVSA